jgi:hypothetical protein
MDLNLTAYVHWLTDKYNVCLSAYIVISLVFWLTNINHFPVVEKTCVGL